MAAMETKEVFDRFFMETYGAEVPDNGNRALLKETIVYEYEIEVGKSLFDMSVDEIIVLFDKFNTGKKNDFFAMKSLNQILSLYRQIFEYYIDNVEIIKNPFANPKLKGTQLREHLMRGKPVLTKERLDEIIRDVHRDVDAPKSDYVELILLLFYDGFETAQEILDFQEKDLDHRRMEVYISGKTIKLSQRCYNLLVKFHNMTEIEGWRVHYLESWRGSYFKIIVKKSGRDTVDDKSPELARDRITGIIKFYINQRYDTNLSGYNIYVLGLYDFITDKYGIEETNKMITSKRDTEAVEKLMNAAREYGDSAKDISFLKRRLLPLMKID